MGYACPVCESPQVDGRHVANHVAFTALTGDDAHERWLAETVPGWGEMGEKELADAVVPHAAETEVAEGFDGEGGTAPAVDRQDVTPDLDGDAASILAEAREYTRRMVAGEGNDTGDGSERSVDDGDGDTGDGDENGDAVAADETD